MTRPSAVATRSPSPERPIPVRPRRSRRRSLGRDLKRHRLLYLMAVPGLIHLLLFKYAPLGGLVIAFQKYSPFLGVIGSPFVGFANFAAFLADPNLWTLVRNTLVLAGLTLLFTFPIPIIFALFLNEVRLRLVRTSVQTLTFLPYFISSAVLVSIMYTLFSPQGGLVNEVIKSAGGTPIFFLAEPEWFRPLYVGMSVWQTFGYSVIIYLAAITAIDPSLYEAAEMDGCGRWRRMRHVTIPGIQNMMIVLFILNVGQILSVDIEKILLMYNPSVYETADVIQTYVYRLAFAPTGFPNYSYGAAVGLIQGVVALVLIWVANRTAKSFSDSRLF